MHGDRTASGAPAGEATRRADDGAPRVQVLGPKEPGGAYVLLLTVAETVAVRFGCHDGGASIPVAAGAVVYVGSARGDAGRPLASRLLRHAARCEGEPHRIWSDLATEEGLLLGRPGPTSPRDKRLRWHVDYLLEDRRVELAAVLALRGRGWTEAELARHVEDSPLTAMLARGRGLGASDHVGRTHVLALPGGRPAWERIVEEIVGLGGTARRPARSRRGKTADGAGSMPSR